MAGRTTLSTVQFGRHFQVSCGLSQKQEPDAAQMPFLHRSHLPLQYWWTAIFASADVGGKPSPMKVARKLGITYKSAWLMCERIQRGRKGRFLQALLRNFFQGKPVETHNS